MTDLTGTAQTIYDEVMDEIHEEITQAFGDLLSQEAIDSLITEIQDRSKEGVTSVIGEYYSDSMGAVKKLILGERLSRVVSAIAKEKFSDLSTDIVRRSFDLVDELRNEIIGEVFEETE